MRIALVAALLLALAPPAGWAAAFQAGAESAPRCSCGERCHCSERGGCPCAKPRPLQTDESMPAQMLGKSIGADESSAMQDSIPSLLPVVAAWHSPARCSRGSTAKSQRSSILRC